MPMQQEAQTNLDQDLKASRELKYNNPELQNDVKQWIKQVLGNDPELPSNFMTSDLIESLKTGVLLCKLINKVYPNSIKYKESNFPFVQMENIEKFLSFCKVKGMQHDELFQTIDLYEFKDPYQVLMSLQSLSRIINAEFPNKYQLIGPNISKKHERPKIPPKPKHLVLGQGGVPWSAMEYGYMNGSNQKTEDIVFGGRRDIIRK